MVFRKAFPKPVHTIVVDGVLETGMGAIGAIAEIPLNGTNGLTGIDNLLFRHITRHGGQARIGSRVAISQPHSTANYHVEAADMAVFNDGNQADIVGEHVAVIFRRNRQCNLELARQILVSIEGLFFLTQFFDAFFP